MLEKIAPGLWSQVEPLSMIGIQFGNRTTVIALENNKLILHSPGKLTPELKHKLDALGDVVYILAPNYYHSLFLEEYVAAYPAVQIHMAPRLNKKRHDIPCAGVLSNDPDTPWQSVLQQCVVEGMPAFNEVVFYHKASRTLILTDLAVNMLHPKGIMTNIHFFIHGANRRFAMSRIVKIMIKNKTTFSDSIKTIMSWDFDRILVSHGEIVPSDGKSLMKNIFRAYL